tara:strand:- start:41 stop:250 length:210 start_codon:yes stop_codon:yes gene_type:complete
MSDSVKKYFEQQEESNILRRRENLHLELKVIKRSVGLVGEKGLEDLEWFLSNRDKIVSNRNFIDLIGNN